MAEHRQSSSAIDFCEFVKRKLIPAISDPSATQQHEFIPRATLQDYLTPNQLRKLLDGHGELETIQTGYLAVFAILVFIGKGIYITRFIRHNKLDDEHLPFEHFEGWPEDCLYFKEQFFKAQWQFCAQPLKIRRLNDTRLSPDVIVPITKRTLLRKGVVSSTYVVDIHPEYDLLSGADDHDRPVTHTYVLKTCGEKDTEHHHKEVEAYKLLMNQDDISQNMVRFYGSWIQNQTYHIILEYVGGGTLTEFFERTKQPSRDEDRIKFWRKLLELVKPVSRMHQPLSSDGQHHYHQGIHHDIKPANILVSQSIGISEFDVTFKLADFGLTNFDIVKNGERPESLDAHSTQMYTAPEYLRGDSFLEQSRLPAKPSKDIWSLGCVFSEAAVWSVFGNEGIKNYGHRRSIATSLVPQLRATAYNGCFHDGEKVLDVVIHEHMDVRQQSGKNDHIVGDILTIIEEMLEEESVRPKVHDIYRRLQKALKVAETWSQKRRDDVENAHFPEAFHTSSDQDIVRAQPPVSPPEESHRFGLGVRISHSPMQSPHSLDGEMHMSSNVMSSSLPLCPRSQSDDRNSTFAPSSIGISRTESLKIPVRHSGIRPPSFYPGSPIAQSQSWPTPGPTPGKDEPYIATDPLEKEIKIQQRNSPKAPVGPSVEQVLKWIEGKKVNSNMPALDGDECLRRLHGRDQVFLIDDSITMKPHWSKVRDTLNALGYLVKRSDLDGIDLYFTNSPEEGHSRDRKNLIKVFNSVKPAGQCNMKVALGKILEAYPPKRPKGEKGFLFRKKGKQKWGLSVYVLTDGVWEDGQDELCGVYEPIATILDKLTRKGLTEQHVGIQFIRFGDNTTGAKRLGRLDSGLRELGILKDVVDTEDFDGDVWKMLIGPLDPVFDNDSP